MSINGIDTTYINDICILTRKEEAENHLQGLSILKIGCDNNSFKDYKVISIDTKKDFRSRRFKNNMLSANMKKGIDKDEDDPKNRDECFETYNKLCFEFIADTDRVYGGDSGKKNIRSPAFFLYL